MSRYRKVSTRMWGDQKFRSLTQAEPSSPFLFVYLLTCPSNGPIPGLFSAGEMAIAEALKWHAIPYLIRYRECYRELINRGMLKADWEAPLVWLPNGLKYNFPANSKIVKGWAAAWTDLPECQLKVEVRQAFMEQLAAKPALLQAFEELSAIRYPKQDRIPYREGYAIPGTGSGTGNTPQPPFEKGEEKRTGEGEEKPEPKKPAERVSFRGTSCDDPELSAVARRIVRHYHDTVKTAHTITTGGDQAVQALLHAGRTEGDLRKASTIYARSCDVQGTDRQHRLSAKKFFGSEAWRNALETPPPQPEPSIGLSQLTPPPKELAKPDPVTGSIFRRSTPGNASPVAQDERGGHGQGKASS